MWHSLFTTSVQTSFSMSQSDSNLSWGHYAFTLAWNSSTKASALIKCQSDVFRIIWHRSTSLCVSGFNWRSVSNKARVAFTFLKNQHAFPFYISYACRAAFPLAINATFDFFFQAKNTKSRNELQWSVCDSITVLTRTNIFI